MLGKFKGLNVPRKDPERSGEFPDLVDKTLKNRFCYKARTEDCTGCGTCLFCMDGKERNDTAFQEWYAAKGKVAYDA
jgi:hypothetical protein